MKQLIRELFRWESIPAVATLFIAVIGISGLLPINFEQTVFALMSLLVINAFIERVIYLRGLQNSIDSLGKQQFLKSRLEDDFQNFDRYCVNANEIFICALSLGFAPVQQDFAFSDRLKHGCNFKIIIVNPELSDDALRIIAEHDERYPRDPEDFLKFLKNEIQRTIKTLGDFRGLPDRKGNLQVRTAKGMPVFTITMVDPNEKHGKMRIELRPYKRNQGERPYFELKKANPADQSWYDFFYKHYYVELWSDSDLILQY